MRFGIPVWCLVYLLFAESYFHEDDTDAVLIITMQIAGF